MYVLFKGNCLVLCRLLLGSQEVTMADVYGAEPPRDLSPTSPATEASEEPSPEPKKEAKKEPSPERQPEEPSPEVPGCAAKSKASKPEPASPSTPREPRLAPANASGSSGSTVLCCNGPSYEEPQQHSINQTQFFLFASLDEVNLVLELRSGLSSKLGRRTLALILCPSASLVLTMVVSASQETAVQKAKRALKAMKKKQQSAGTNVKQTIQKTVTCMQLSVSGFSVHKTLFPAIKCAQDSKVKSKDDDDACDTAAGESHAEASSSVKQPKGKGSGIVIPTENIVSLLRPDTVPELCLSIIT